MIPIPPITREIEASTTSSVSRVWLAWICALITSSGRRTLKSSSWPRWMRWRWRRSAVTWSMAASTAPGDRAEQTMSSSQVEVPPRSFRWAEVQGMRRVSSWSIPVVDCPLGARTPMITKGKAFTRTIWPTGSAPPKIRLRRVSPITATLSPRSTCSSLKNAPLASGQRLMAAQSGEMPR